MTKIEVNYAGMRGLKSAADLNAGYLKDVHAFVTANCNNAGAFTGFLGIFKDQYQEAYTTAEESLSKGGTSATAIATTIAANRRTYRQRDVEASTRLKGITVEVDLPTIPGMTVEPGPLVTKADKNVASGSGVVEDLDEGVRDLEREHGLGPKHRGRTPGNPLPIIGVLGEVESLANTVDDGESAMDDQEDYENFENEGQR